MKMAARPSGELRYVRNIPGGRRQRAPPDGAAVVISKAHGHVLHAVDVAANFGDEFFIL